MSELQHLFRHPTAILLDGRSCIPWQGVVVALLLAAVPARVPGGIRRAHGMRWQAQEWMLMLTCPILTLTLLAQPPHELNASPGGQRRAAGVSVRGGRCSRRRDGGPESPAERLVRAMRSAAPRSRARVLVAVWVMGVALLSLRLLAGWLHVHASEAFCVPVINRSSARDWPSCRVRMGIDKPVALLESALAQGPR